MRQAIVNFKMIPSRIPNVTIPRMIQTTTKCPEQQSTDPESLSEFFGGSGDRFFGSLIGSVEGAPFSVSTTRVGAAIIVRMVPFGIAMWCMDPWNDLWSMCGVPGGPPVSGNPPFEISATDLALRTVVAPDMTEGGTELGPMEMAG